MTIHLVRDEIERFLSESQGGVLTIAGKWGVGKTYAWNRFLSEASGKRSFAADHYAYVSLFGLGNLEELKAAIFQNTIRSSDIGKAADLQTLDAVVRAAPGLWRKAGNLGRLIPGADKYLSTFDKVGFFWVKNQVICIDDLERRSRSLDIRDVLGLVSYLKEQRGCKVVLLLNDERMIGDDEEEFRVSLEKVADVTLRFEPTPNEAADIGVDDALSFRDKLRLNCSTLGIVNIRTIKKIERMAKRLSSELTDFDDRVFDQALHTLALLEFAKLQPGDAPTLDYLKSLNNYSAAFAEILADGGQADPQQEVWRSLLSAYGFTQMDEFDGVIFRAVNEGHLDPELLRREATALEERIRAADDDRSFEDAWDLYHGSFDDNADEVATALAEAVQKTPKAISPMNLSSTISVLKELQWNGDIAALLANYVAARGDAGKDFWNLDRSAFGGHVQDADVRQAFADKLATLSEDKDPAELLQGIANERGWNPEDIRYLATLSADDFYEIFKSLRGTNLRQAVAGALWFRDVANGDADMTRITTGAVSALQRIAAESAINRRRVAQKGVEIPDAE